MRDHSEMELMLKGYGLTTAQILYHLPDHPHLLQTLSGRTTTSRRNFRCCSGSSSSGRPSSTGRCIRSHTRTSKLIAPNEWRKVDGEFVLH